MQHYIGLDIALKETAICVINGDGEVIEEKRLPSHPPSLIAYVESLPFEICKIGMEACNMANWLHDSFTEAGHDCVCIDAYQASQTIRSMRTNKTDRNDAWGLAQLLRAGLYKAVHVRSVENRALAGMLTTRKTLVRQRVDMENAIRGHFRQYGVRISGGEQVFIRNARAALVKLPRLGESVEPLLELLEQVTATYRQVHNKLRRWVKEDRVCSLLMTIPGVGPVSAATFRAVIDDPTRFAKSKTVPAYIGLTPKIYSSGETERYGRISKHGHPGAREALFDAAGVLLTRTRRWCALKYWGVQIARRSCLKKAKIAVARKLAVIMHQVWIHDTPYRPVREVPVM